MNPFLQQAPIPNVKRIIAVGSGKGGVEFWVAVIKPGRVLFELSYPNEKTAREALLRASHKLPMKCRIIKREEGDA